MALDKQKILSELGNVVNQLESADCGCMGKLFSNSGQMNPNTNHTPNEFAVGNRSCCSHHGCHGHGYNAPCAGEPYAGARHCMGFCDPPKLYADTYKYLNGNMMQPVVQEVYDDLKSINTTNTVVNNPMAYQMGLPQGNNLNQGNNPNQSNNVPQNAMPGHSVDSQNYYTPSPHLHFPDSPTFSGHNPNMYNANNHLEPGQGIDQMGKGGGQMGQSMGQMSQNMGQMGQNMGQMGQNMGQMGQNMGQMGQNMDQMGQNMGHLGHNTGQMGQNMGQTGHNMSQMGQSTGQMDQHIGQKKGQMNQDMYLQDISQTGHARGQTMGQPGGTMAGMGPQIVNMMSSSTRQNFPAFPNNGNTFSNSPDSSFKTKAETKGQQYVPGYKGMENLPTENNRVAGHGYSNTMPGNMHQMEQNTMQNQMGKMNTNLFQSNNPNPYGKHGAGVAKFNEMFPGVMKNDLGFDPMAIAIQMNPANQQRSAMDSMQKMMMNNSPGINNIMDSPRMQPVLNTTNAVAASLSQPNERLTDPGPPCQEHFHQQQPREIPEKNNQMPQQVYTAVTGASNMNSQHVQNQEHLQQPSDNIQQPPNGPVASKLPTVYEGLENPASNHHQQAPSTHNTQLKEFVQPLYKDPILPADTSRNLLLSHHFKSPKYEYNTLGQPVQMVSALDYQTLIPDLPQTVCGKVVPRRTSTVPMKFNNVKATVSKTALVGSRPIGKTPSRSQLNHLYNQYRGSQSFTQQNIRPGYNGSSSEGRISIPQGEGQVPPTYQHQHIERVGGDTAANNQLIANAIKLESKDHQIGDVPQSTKQPNDSVTTRARNNKTRNGLQDQVFSTYPGSAKWSFHGTTPVPYSTGYRFRGAK